MLNDLRYAVRVAARTPIVTAAAVLSLALAIGANTTIFSVLQGVILKPLPYPQPDRLVAVYETKPARGWNQLTVSRLNLADFRTQSSTIQSFAAFRSQGYTLTSPGDPAVLSVGQVDADFLPLLGASPSLGRLFTHAEDVSGKNNVAVISTSLWRSRFNADPNITSRALVMGGKHYAITGVLPDRFEYIYGQDYDVWVPITNDPDMTAPRTHRNLQVFGRLQPGVTANRATTEINGIMANIARVDSRFQGCGARVVPLADDYIGGVKRSVWLLQAAVAFVLLIACANISNLLLARSTARRKELGMRLALGASRWRLLRQSLIESVLLAALGGAAGLLLATWSIDLARKLAPLPRIGQVHLDLPALAAAFFFTAVAALAAGITPALRTADASIAEALQSGARTGSDRHTRWTRDLLVAAQIALAFVLLAGAALLLDSFRRLSAVALGFDYSNRLTAFLLCPDNKYPTRERLIRHLDDLIENIHAIPGVRSATLASSVPLSGYGDGSQSFSIDGLTRDGQLPPVARYRNIWPGFFSSLSIPVVAGREFAATDRAGAPPVVIVNQTLVKRYLNGADPLGRRIRWNDGAVEIVGVAADTRFDGPNGDPEPEVYFSYPQSPRWGFYLVVHGNRDAADLTNAVRHAVTTLDPEQPLVRPTTLSARLDRRFSQPRWYATIMGLFAAIAVSLALIGVYGVMQYTVSLRMREFGIRQALGASPADVLRLVLTRGGFVALIGITMGLLLSLATSRMLANLLFGVRGNDPAILTATAALLLTAALAAIILPARTARTADPTVWLRDS